MGWGGEGELVAGRAGGCAGGCGAGGGARFSAAGCVWHIGVRMGEKRRGCGRCRHEGGRERVRQVRCRCTSSSSSTSSELEATAADQPKGAAGTDAVPGARAGATAGFGVATFDMGGWDGVLVGSGDDGRASMRHLRCGCACTFALERNENDAPLANVGLVTSSRQRPKEGPSNAESACNASRASVPPAAAAEASSGYRAATAAPLEASSRGTTEAADSATKPANMTALRIASAPRIASNRGAEPAPGGAQPVSQPTSWISAQPPEPSWVAMDASVAWSRNVGLADATIANPTSATPQGALSAAGRAGESGIVQKC